MSPTVSEYGCRVERTLSQRVRATQLPNPLPPRTYVLLSHSLLTRVKNQQHPRATASFARRTRPRSLSITIPSSLPSVPVHHSKSGNIMSTNIPPQLKKDEVKK